MSIVIFQNSIIKVCQEFPDKISCSFHVTQQNIDVEQKLQSYTTSKFHTFYANVIRLSVHIVSLSFVQSV